MTPESICPKLIALDLDGTLLNSAGKLSERSLKAIAGLKAKGTRLVLCTGRPPRYIKMLADELELADLVVAYNGAAIVNLTKQTADYRHQLSRAEALELLRVMRHSHPEAMAGMETHHGWYLDEQLYAIRKPQLLARNLALPDGYGELESFITNAVIKVFFRHPDIAAETLSHAIKDLGLYATWSSPYLLEVMATKVNKQEAIAHLAEQYDFAQHQVAAFGDQNNDKELISWAGFGVAMANASEELKSAADFVTSSNNEDGVARVLEAWL
ncbi:MAG: HAD family phosphatase [Trueperaceae bacterium]|nr:HAD family phosphatase [Trueperaceae bacterium]